MSYDYAFANEDRAAIRTSRWNLTGVSTLASGNLLDGRLWFTASDSADTVTVNVYKDPGLDAGDKVMSGTADISGIADAPAKCTLDEASSSGLSGWFYFEGYAADPAAAGVELVVTFAMDADLALYYGNIADLPGYDATNGMAEYILAATEKCLLLASNQHAEQLGGYSAPESPYRTAASRSYPDYRRISNPDQLKEACVHWALSMVFGRSHERADNTMYSERRDYHDEQRREAVAAWNLTFNTDPDTDDDADTQASAAMVPLERL